MEDSYVVVNGIPTRVITCGGSINGGNHETVILIIAGNPGVASYYTEFVRAIHKELGIPVWVLSHAGHDMPSNGQCLPSLSENQHVYNLDGQIEHKKAFIEKYIPKTTKLYLVGHSIGCKIIFELLKISDIKDRVNRCYLLFPAIEHLALSPNGKKFIKIAKYLLPFMLAFCWVLCFFPVDIIKALITMYFYIVGTPLRGNVAPTATLLHPVILRNVFYLGMDEMKKVTYIDNEALKNFGNMVLLYFGSQDGWCPVENVIRFKEHYPNVQALLCERKFEHAFVLYSSQDVGKMVAEWIRTDLSLKTKEGS